MLEALANYALVSEKLTEEQEARSRIKIAEERAKFAQMEIDSGFAIVNSHVVAALWGSEEAFLHNFACQWLMNRPESLLKEPWSNLRVRVGEYEKLDPEAKVEYLFEMLEQSLGSNLKQGINRFESIFHVLGLSGSVEKTVKDSIFELQQIRNVVVHKRGIADRRLCTACPWLDLQPGQRVLVSSEMINRYSMALLKYTMQAKQRVVDFFRMLDIRQSCTAANDSEIPSRPSHSIENEE